MKKTLLLFIILITNKTYTQCFSAVDAGMSFNMAIKTDGTLWTWGTNTNAQLGNGSKGSGPEFNITHPTQVGSDTNWQKISAGQFSSLAIKTDGTLWAWGGDDSGSHEVDNPTVKNTPTQVGNDSNWKEISAGRFYSLAIKTDGTLWELKDITKNIIVPTQIGGDSDWQSIELGYDFNLAIKTNGALWAWGSNVGGQFGNGTTTSSSVPIQIGTDTDWSKISSGMGYSIAVKNNGTLWVWGINLAGEFGNGTTTGSLFPIQVGNDTNWKNVDASGSTSIAMKNDGTLWASGNGGNGQLGLGSTKIIRTFTQIEGSNWQNISTDLARTMAINDNGDLYSWGADGYGALGNGPIKTADVHYPEMIAKCNIMNVSNFDIIEISIHPNPVNDKVRIVSNNVITRIEIYDFNGRLITSINDNSSIITLNLEKFKIGMHFLKIVTEKGNSIQKIIKK